MVRLISKREFLIEKLEQNNLSRLDLAKGADIPYTTISRIMTAKTENGREFYPAIETILKLADYFNCTIDEVIKRAAANGVEKFYLPSIDSSTLQAMLDLEKKFPGKCIAMAGLHPCSVKENYKEESNACY